MAHDPLDYATKLPLSPEQLEAGARLTAADVKALSQVAAHAPACGDGGKPAPRRRIPRLAAVVHGRGPSML
jgi:hypothetical protein